MSETGADPDASTEHGPGPPRPGPLASVGLVAVVLSMVAVLTVVDLSPRVESDFFFATDDPQLVASQRIAELFPARDQLLVSATGPDITDPAYLDRVRALTEELAALGGVAGVQSLTRGPSTPAAVASSPIWSRLLLGTEPDPERMPNMSQLVLAVRGPEEGGPDGRTLVSEVDAALAGHHRASFSLDVSGVPYVVELIRRSLERDLRTFSVAALAVFGLLVALVYRSAWLVAGTLFTCLGACALTLTVLALAGSHIGLLTANIVTIVFVLTLSHLVFLTANWRAASSRAAGRREADPRAAGAVDGGAVDEAVAITRRASIWCMATTLLGFASLLTADAEPLRELGVAGAVGTAVAILVAYALYPVFLHRAAARGAPPGTSASGGSSRGDCGAARLLALGPPASAGLLALTALAAFALPRLDTDPNLLSYFEPGSQLRQGLERIDRNGGSSPLLLVVSDPGGGRLDSRPSQERMGALQQAFDRSTEVGTALSLPVLLEEARRVPMAFLLDTRRLLDLLDTEAFDRVARSFVTEDRALGLYFLRMRESDREAPRRQVIELLESEVSQAGLRLELTGGLYELQASLGELVAASVFRGLGGLLLLFALIALVVARSLGTAGSMIVSLAAVPVLVLGVFGLAGQPLDLISSPAANVAIALGIDSMIHLVAAVRRHQRGDRAPADAGGRQERAGAWRTALAELWPAIVGATGILAAGFGIFALSSFPPTQRFGVAVALGTTTAAAMALLVLPFLARRFSGSRA
ncbi:MAG: MMPL family transporter [Holophagales bacterium]|nr:MMPL family transporter [Holophagales bacterium]